MKFIIQKKEKVKQFSVIFNHLKSLSENINISFSRDGLYAQGMTSCHCSFFELNLHREWFKEYICEEDCVVGVNCEILFKCISSLEEDQTISFDYPIDSDKIYLNFEGVESVSKYFELPLITIDTENLEVPDVDYEIMNLELNSEKLNKWINQISIFGEEVTIKFKNSKMYLSAKSATNGKMEIKMDTQEESDIQLELVYGVEYLKNICQFSKVNNNLELSTGENFPLKIRYDLSIWCDKINDEDNDYIEHDNGITFYVAPKNED